MATYPAPNPPFIGARYRGGAQTPKALVLHGTVSSDNRGTARNIAKWWAGPTSPKSSCHYVVDPGEVIQCVGDHTVAYHCGYNTGSIGIEFCDEQTGPASRWQDADSLAILRRGARLTAQLCLAYNIAPIRPTVAQLKAKGPHGIYSHNDSRLAFGHTTHTDPRDFPWPLFLRLVRSQIAKIKAAAEAPKTVRLHVGHWSAQFSDTPGQQATDAEAVFARAQRRKEAWITGTEGGGREFRALLRTAAEKYGYRFFFKGPNDAWLAVRKDLIAGNVSVEMEVVTKAGEGFGPHGDRGVLAVSFDTKNLGRITVLACHYLTRGRPGAKTAEYRQNVEINARLAAKVGELAKRLGAGSALVFYGGDQNIVDRDEDTFMGQPLTSSWDELEKWENTGHGNIDVIASYDKDGRVVAVYCRALDDTEFKLFGDHFLVESGFDVVALAA